MSIVRSQPDRDEKYGQLGPKSFMVVENGLQGCWGEGAMQSMLQGAERAHHITVI